MKKVLKYLEWVPFAIALGSLIIYLVYTIQIKMNPAIIITDKLIGTLKTYLIIALVSLFIGLLIILIKKIYKLMISNAYTTEKITTTKTVTQTTPVLEKTTITETKKDDKIVVKEEKVVTPIITKDNIVEDSDKQIKVIEKQTEETYEYKPKKVLCPDCNNYISKDAAICPHCGILFDDEVIRILKKYEKKKEKVKRSPKIFIINICLTILFIILIFLICNMLYNKYNQNLRNINNIIQR